MPSPEYMARAEKFQRIFSTYFPYLKEDMHQAAFEMEWIWYGFMNNQIHTVRRQQAKRELQQLISVLRRLSEREVPYWQMAIQIGKETRTRFAPTKGTLWTFCFRSTR